jgi:methylmalonyl-CoA/ethylmalonyl-CoA epimerase
MPSDIVPFLIAEFNQVAMVVRDLDAAVRNYWERFAIGPWRILDFGPDTVRELTYRGKPQPYAMRIALAMQGDLQLELIESIQGPNIYEDFLRDHGEGMHHFGIWIPDIRAAIKEMEARGYVMIQSGLGTGADGEGGYAYFETEGQIATTIELIELPKERVATARLYPADA